MIFEVADDEWVHTSIMSGLAPIKSQDEILGVRRRVGPVALPDALAGGARARSRRAARRRTRRASATGSSRSSARTTTRSRRSTRWRPRSARDGAPHPQLVANDMVATVDDPELGKTTQVGVPIHLLGTPGGDPGPAPAARAAQRRDLRRARLLAPTTYARSRPRRRWSDARARRRRRSSTSASTSRGRSGR